MAKEITIALAGNPNSGKSTVFNNLTGARQHVGNWPGVTVERKEGSLNYGGYAIKVVDLPGVYSLTAYSLDEVVTRNFVVEEKPDVVIDVVDASNLERNLYLAVQFMEMGARLIIALNMMDQAESRGYAIDVPYLSQLLGVPIIPMVASHNRGTEELLSTIIDVAENDIQGTELRLRYDEHVDEELTKLEDLVSQSELSQKYSPRWLSIKLLEEDEDIIKKFKE